MIRLLFTLTLGFSTSTALAYPDSLCIIDQMVFSRTLISEKEILPAELLIKEGFDHFIQNDDLYNWINWHQKIAKTLRKNGYCDAAINTLHQGIEGLWRLPINEKGNERLAWLYAETGFTHKACLSDSEGTQKYYLKAKDIFVDSLGIENFKVARFIYPHLGNTYTQLRDFELADFYLGRALKISAENKEWTKWVETCSDLALMHNAQGDYGKALEEAERGLIMLDSISLKSKTLLLINLGLVHINLCNYTEAKRYTEQVIHLVSNKSVSPSLKLARMQEAFMNKGKISEGLEDYPGAEEHYLEAIETLKSDKINPSRRTHSILLLKLGGAHLKNQKPLKAIDAYQEILEAYCGQSNEWDTIKNPPKEELFAEPLLRYALRGKSKCLRELFNHSPEKKYLEEALACLELANHVNQLSLKLYTSEGSRRELLSENKEIKNESLAIAYLLLARTQNSDWATKMLAISEDTRSILLRENQGLVKLIQEDAKDSLRTAYLLLNQEIEQLKSQNYHVATNTEIPNSSKTQKPLADLLQHRKVLIDQLSKLYPTWRDEPENEYVLLQKIENSLLEGQVFVEYFVTDNVVYIFSVDSKTNGVQVIKQDWSPVWEKRANRIGQAIMQQKNGQYLSDAYELYQHLLHPVLQNKDCSDLIIAPDESIWGIPFAALLTKSVAPKNKVNFKSLNYLIHKFQISYAFSGWLLKNKASETQISGQLMAFGPAYERNSSAIISPIESLNRNSLDTLLNNQKEVTGIRELCGGTQYVGQQATKKSFLNSIHSNSYMHIAGHAKANHENPDLSFIAFSNINDNMDIQFKLYAYEIYRRPMPIDMLVLSTCESNLGPIWTGEGQISLARAFAFSGTKSIVSTLWSIDDKKSKGIMLKFYEHLKVQARKSGALQQAQKNYIINAEDNSRAHPRYWAAFTAIGNMDPVHFKPSMKFNMIYAIIFGIAALCVYGFVWPKISAKFTAFL